MIGGFTGKTAHTIDSALLTRVEDAGINASAPREQCLVDGWLVRFSPGSAKRARCVQAVSPGITSIDDKLARCRPFLETAGLPLFVRITPFSEPAGLDAHLEAAGMARVDESRVMIAATLPPAAPLALPDDARIVGVDARAFANWIGRERQSSAKEREAHAERLEQAPVPHRAFFVVDRDNQPNAGGQLVLESDLAGLYDVFTDSGHRQRGLARALCGWMLAEAAASGARIGYLQVDAANEPARSVYRSLGFVDAYAYHYRTPHRVAEARGER